MITTDVPGVRIRELRQKAGYTLRELAEECNPPMDFSALARIERNQGYTSCTLKRIAVALDCTVLDFFLPDDMTQFTRLPEEAKADVAQYIQRRALEVTA